jgi:hypothetical protein
MIYSPIIICMINYSIQNTPFLRLWNSDLEQENGFDAQFPVLTHFPPQNTVLQARIRANLHGQLNLLKIVDSTNTAAGDWASSISNYYPTEAAFLRVSAFIISQNTLLWWLLRNFNFTIRKIKWFHRGHRSLLVVDPHSTPQPTAERCIRCSCFATHAS